MEGFVLGIVNMANLHYSISGMKKENFLILIDKEGKMVIDTRQSITEVKIDQNPPEISAVNERLKESELGTFEFEENIISFKKYKDYTLILVKPRESVLLIQKTVFNIMMYSLGFVILLVIVASLIFSRIITRPIESLTQKVNDVTTGNLNIQLEKGETQEVQSLTESLNRILASMKLAILRTGASKGELGLQEAIEAKVEAENKFKLLYETSNDAIMTLEPPTWKFTSGNPATVKMFGTKDEKEFTSLGPWELSPERQPDGQRSGDKAKKMIMKAMKEGSNFFEWTHKRYKGNDFPATVLLSRIGEGEKAYLQATVRDLTQLKKSEEEMRLHYEVIKNMSEGVYLIGLNDGIIKYANPKFEKLFGFKPGEMVGKHVSIVNAPTDLDPKQTAKKIMDVLKKIGEWHGEVQNIKKDGTKFWCYANVSVMEHPIYGKVLVAVHRDITEQKKLEEESKISETKYRRLFETAQDAILILDAETGKITDANPFVQDLLGYSAKELTGKQIWQISPLKEVVANKEKFRELQKKGYVRYRNLPLETKKGKKIYVEFISNVYDVDRTKIIQCNIRDDTERTKAEEELRKLKENKIKK